MTSIVIDSSSTNIPTSYTTATTSKIISSCQTAGTVCFINKTSQVLAFSIGTYGEGETPSSTATVASPGRDGFIPDSGSIIIDFYKINMGQSLFIRSATGTAASSGKLYVWVR